MNAVADDVAQGATETVERAVRGTLTADTPVLLAVSGGVDSMVMLDAACAVARPLIAGVATFDHGTGEAATRGVELVTHAATSRGLRLLASGASLSGRGEAAWREARWAFFHRAAAAAGAGVIAVGHTRDDQLETVVMRLLRGAGARGLAALAAPSRGIVRPLLDLDRATIAAYAAARGVTWVDDPSNRSPRFLRNRVRHELLPALGRASPGLADALLGLAQRAAAWRRDVDAFVDDNVSLVIGERGALLVATTGLARYDAKELAVLWPAIAARAGVRLDRRGTARLVEFTIEVAAGAAVGAEMQLSGAIDVMAGRGEIVLRPRSTAAPPAPGAGVATALPLAGDVRLGGWRLRPVAGERVMENRDGVWHAWLPSNESLVVRPWRPGDRMRVSQEQPARRVKRFFADARIAGRARVGWPVVVAGDEIVWIPGVRRSFAATDRPDRPGVHYICERIDD